MTFKELKQIVGDKPFVWKKWKNCYPGASEKEIIGQLFENRDIDPITGLDHTISNVEWEVIQNNNDVGLILVDWFDSTTEAVKCECGAESIGVGAHSHWCGKAEIV